MQKKKRWTKSAWFFEVQLYGPIIPPETLHSHISTHQRTLGGSIWPIIDPAASTESSDHLSPPPGPVNSECTVIWSHYSSKQEAVPDPQCLHAQSGGIIACSQPFKSNSVPHFVHLFSMCLSEKWYGHTFCSSHTTPHCSRLIPPKL